jgi:transposase
VATTLIQTCELNDVDPRAWPADMLARLPGHHVSRIEDLPPWNWEAPIAPPQRDVA